MLDMTLEQGQQVFLKALAGNNFSAESIRAYNADITQFVEFLKSVRVDWNNPQKITAVRYCRVYEPARRPPADGDNKSPETGLYPAFPQVPERE